MDWFYIQSGHQVGPITESDFQQRVQQGTIGPETQVWNNTMSGWQPYSTVVAARSPQQRRIACSQCKREFLEGNLIQYEGRHICGDCKPLFFQRLQEGALPALGGIWREQNRLVMDKSAQLPDACVKCNQPARGKRLKRTLFWHPPAWYALICLGFLFYLVAALIVRKRAEIQIGLCEKHSQSRKYGILAAWSLFLLCILALVIGISMDLPGVAALGSLFFLASVLVGVVSAQTVVATKMTDQMVWLKGVHRSYLEQFPEYIAS